MKKKYYLPKNDPDLVTWFQNLSAKIDDYSAKYGLTTEEVDFIKAAALYFAYWVGIVDQLKATIKGIVSFKDEIRDGVAVPGGSESVMPNAIPFTSPPAVPHGILRTVRSIVGRIKKHTAYTSTDGDDLKIEGADQEEETETLKPLIKIKLNQGRPEVIWKKGIATAIKIKVHRNVGSTGSEPPMPMAAANEGFEFLAVDTQPNYIDTAPLPPLTQSAVWAYVAKYIIGDEEAGDWSDIVFVTVTGTP